MDNETKDMPVAGGFWHFDGRRVRVADVDGEPWFAVKDLRTIHGWPAGHEETLDFSDRTLVALEGEPGSGVAVSELGMHAMIAGSLQFRPFLRWLLLEFRPRWIAGVVQEAVDRRLEALVSSDEFVDAVTKAVLAHQEAKAMFLKIEARRLEHVFDKGCADFFGAIVATMAEKARRKEAAI
jgi:hypothetical protein